MLIDSFAKIGLAYDLKKPPAHLVKARMQRSGDGTDNRTIRRGKLHDWLMGIFVTTSQLIFSLSLRAFFMWLRRYRNPNYNQFEPEFSS